MLVYGQPQHQARLSVLLEHLHRRRARTRADSLEELRSLVIQAGQLEQGVADYWAGRDRLVLERVARITDWAARAFCAAWAAAVGREAPREGASAEAALAGLGRELEGFELHQDPVLCIRIPEGFEFYSLFPEQYCSGAWDWARRHAGRRPKTALVLGLRSIGTTLSALVGAALQAAGWKVQRLTVRPTGHPFTRRVQGLPKAGLGLEMGPTRPCALVVDEGPGLSGSSMAAAAEALFEAGYREISFFPGHNGEPGSAASAEVRRWWASIPRYWTRLADLRWHGLTLAESLTARTEELSQKLGRPADSLGVEPDRAGFEDLGGGLWRQRVFAREAEWPAICPGFERSKFLCVGRNGAAVLWKFAGLGCEWAGGQTAAERVLAQMRARSRTGWVAEPLGSFRGFIALPWLEGQRLHHKERYDGALLGHLGRYLTAAAGPALAEAEAKAATGRLREMLHANTREALGEALAERAFASGQAAELLEPGPAYGDGRLAPHEWVRTPDGRLLKTDCFGHDLDHTLVGKQSVLWDAAGALVEWGLAPGAAGPLLEPLRQAGIRLEPKALRF